MLREFMTEEDDINLNAVGLSHYTELGFLEAHHKAHGLTTSDTHQNRAPAFARVILIC